MRNGVLIRSVGKVMVVAALAALAGLASASQTVTYSYDELGRLVKTVTSGTVNGGRNTTISYDAAGNRTNYLVTGATTVSISNASTTEGAVLTFTATLQSASAASVTVNYATSSGTATSGSDFTAASGSLTMPAGQTSQTISVSTIDDSAVESSETLTVTLSSPAGASLGTASGTGTINDNDVVPANLAIGNASANEGGVLAFTVTRSGNTAIAASASYASGGWTASSGTDFNSTSGTVSFAVGQTSATINVSTIDDTEVESTEAMTVVLSSPAANTTIVASTGTGSITDNDVPLANLSIGNASATEGGALTFTVTRTGNTASAISVSYASASGTATSGTDFTAVSGTLSFAASQTSATINVTTTDELTVESSESMTVSLSSPSAGATIASATGTGTILDNDFSWSASLVAGSSTPCSSPPCMTPHGFSPGYGSLSPTGFFGHTVNKVYSIGSSVFFGMVGTSAPPANSGWTQITIPVSSGGSLTLTRSTASYAVSGNSATWTWAPGPRKVISGGVTIR